ncbi:MAG: HEAT repeat domain-containing protein, partial [Gemmatimonadota bacterium]|nr:HEAT repeat domain-containing protein [Gemmatimonadota bacterium]
PAPPAAPAPAPRDWHLLPPPDELHAPGLMNIDVEHLLENARHEIEMAMPSLELAMESLPELMDLHVASDILDFNLGNLEMELMDRMDHLGDLELEMGELEWRLQDIEPLVTEAIKPGLTRAFEMFHDMPAAGAMLAPGSRFGREASFRTVAPAPWAPKDQADSLYREARELLNRGDYRRAADLFGQIPARYPRSEYAADALYWQAFALYRIGATDELRAALAALDAQRSRYPRASTQTDAATLATRIRGALASRGDARAAASVERTAGGNGTSCDKEDLAVRIEALNALGQMDPEAAAPILSRVVGRRDACSEALRKRAVFLLGRRGDETAALTLAEVARSEPDRDVRSDAILWLSRMPGDGAVGTLEEILRTTDDEQIQRAAVRALAAHPGARARQAVRALIERADVPEKLRSDAIGSFDKDRASDDDAAYLRALYPRLESPRLKERVISAIGRLGGAENDAWLLTLARNATEPVEMRTAALSRLTSRSSTPIAELVGLYNALPDRELRERLVSVYSRRKEPEATDKLLEIARGDADPRLRRLAISALTRKNDPRTQKLLLEIIDQ